MVKVPIWAYYCMNSYVTTRARSTRVLQYCHSDYFVLLTSSRLDGGYVPIPTWKYNCRQLHFSRHASVSEYGNVYLIFPIEELSVQIGKCKSSVKTALKELDDVGLLVRRSGGFSKPNHLYVKIPSDEIGLQTVDDKAVGKMAVIESEIWHLVK